MAEDRMGMPEGEAHDPWAWTELFRTFQVALDPKKLLLAAVGILVMFVGWWLLSLVFFNSRSVPRETDYSIASYQKNDPTLTEAEAQVRARRDYLEDLNKYQFLESLAGPDGKLRINPWDEDRGPNPFLLVTGQYREGSSYGRVWEPGHFLGWFLTEQVPVLIEPLAKVLRPVVLMLSPRASFWTHIYLLFVTFWTLATWALFGGAITRLAAVQFAGKDRPGLIESVRFVVARYVSYLSAPLVPLAFVALIVVLMVLYGLIHLIPFVGDVADSIVWPILMLLSFGQAILLVGLVGYPLMYATVSAEGSDTFDALSRSYNYVFQAPWNYIWYGVVTVVYGAVLVFFVVFMGSFVVYLSKWSLSQTPGTGHYASRQVDNLFVYSPTTFHWHQLLVTTPGVEIPVPSPNDPTIVHMEPNPATFAWYNQISAVMVGGFWVMAVLLLVLGFGYSYYFSAFTMVYLLMRRKVDDTEMDEVYLEEDEPEEPLLPPAPPPAAPSGPGMPLQMVEPPTIRTAPPVTPDGASSPPIVPERPADGSAPAN